MISGSTSDSAPSGCVSEALPAPAWTATEEEAEMLRRWPATASGGARSSFLSNRSLCQTGCEPS